MTSCPLWCKSWPRKFILDVGNRSCVFYFFGFVYFKFLYSEETWYQFIFAIILDHCWTGHLAYRTFEQWAGRSFGPNVLLFIYLFIFFDWPNIHLTLGWPNHSRGPLPLGPPCQLINQSCHGLIVKSSNGDKLREEKATRPLGRYCQNLQNWPTAAGACRPSSAPVAALAADDDGDGREGDEARPDRDDDAGGESGGRVELVLRGYNWTVSVCLVQIWWSYLDDIIWVAC